MKRSIFILTLFLAVAAFSIAPIMAPCPTVEISKRMYCPTGVGYSDNPEDWDNSTPVYLAHEKLVWWIEINVTALADMTEVVVYDRLGAEFMVEGIHNTTIPPFTPEPVIDYIFDYAGKDTEVERITYGQAVSANGYPGTVDKGDMFKGTGGGINIGNFRIFWTGNSCKVHFMWTIGDLDAGETATIYLVISTDLNPAGIQEFTSCGTYFLNSGATVKGLINGRQVSAEADPIKIKVIED